MIKKVAASWNSPSFVSNLLQTVFLSSLALPSPGKGPSFGEGVEEGILKGICKRGMESGPDLSHTQEVVGGVAARFNHTTSRQELYLKHKRCEHSPAGEWLLESHLLTGAD